MEKQTMKGLILFVVGLTTIIVIIIIMNIFRGSFYLFYIPGIILLILIPLGLTICFIGISLLRESFKKFLVNKK